MGVGCLAYHLFTLSPLKHIVLFDILTDKQIKKSVNCLQSNQLFENIFQISSNILKK